ncbi:MAG: MFS transporter [Deltaproteobacteria bacterium]
MDAATGRVPMARLAATSLLGASIEWFDFYLYGAAAALVFPTLYFPKSMPPMVALLASFSTFAVGFFARPVGAVLFGHFGDRIGRKAALAAALVLMGVSTALVGLLPSYATIGVIAPTLLVVLRFTQGLAIGGQWGGAMLLVVESAPPEKRGFYGSFAQVGAPAGVVLANLAFLIVAALTSHETFMSWGWRIPFVMSLGLVGLAWYVHVRVEETAAFKKLSASRAQAPKGRSPILEAFASHPRQILLAAGAFVAVQVSFYISITFVMAYGTNPQFGLGLPQSTLLGSIMVSSALMAPTLLWFGRLSDRFGRRRIFKLGAVCVGLWSFAFFPLIDTRSPLWITVAVAGALVLNGMMYGPQAALFGELFRTRVRYSGASLGYQLGSACGGGLAPLVAMEILHRTHGTFGIALYMAGACCVTLLCVSLLGAGQTGDLADDGT